MHVRRARAPSTAPFADGRAGLDNPIEGFMLTMMPALPQTSPRGRTARWLLLALAIASGALVGVGLFTFGYGQGLSYLSYDPNACTNCHVMQSYFDSWQKSSHQHVAVCNDCHLPHHPVGKYVVKADNGFFHSWAFTTDDFHEPIRIKARNRRVTQQACLHCHTETVSQMQPATVEGTTPLCVHCHPDVGHALEP